MFRGRAIARCQLRRNTTKTDINLIKRGTTILMDNKLYVVNSSMQRSQARGGAHYKLELKDLQTGAKAFERINAGQTLTTVELTQKSYQFMYADDNLHLIDQESFEEVVLDPSLIQAPSGLKCIPFLTDANVVVDYYQSKPISIKVPEKVNVKVIECGLAQSSSTDGSKGVSFKNVTLENSVQIQCPDFVQVDDVVTVNIHTMQYHSRV